MEYEKMQYFYKNIDLGLSLILDIDSIHNIYWFGQNQKLVQNLPFIFCLVHQLNKYYSNTSIQQYIIQISSQNLYNLMSAKDNNSQNSDHEASNDFANLEFVARKTTKIFSQSSIHTVQKLQNAQHSLINSITIYTPTKIKAAMLRKQLKNYRFRKFADKIFGKSTEILQKQQQLMIITLVSLMSEFRRKPHHYFYIISGNQEDLIYFYHAQKKDESFNSYAACCSCHPRFKEAIQKQKIQFLQIQEQNPESNVHRLTSLLIKNQHINIFWGHILNKIILDFKSFEIVSNFGFQNSYQESPVETFNGIQHKKFDKYRFIAENRFNIIGQTVQEIYRMKIEGYWSMNNVKAVTKALEQKFDRNKFELEYQEHRCSKGLHNLNRDE